MPNKSQKAQVVTRFAMKPLAVFLESLVKGHRC